MITHIQFYDTDHGTHIHPIDSLKLNSNWTQVTIDVPDDFPDYSINNIEVDKNTFWRVVKAIANLRGVFEIQPEQEVQ